MSAAFSVLPEKSEEREHFSWTEPKVSEPNQVNLTLIWITHNFETLLLLLLPLPL